MIKSYGVLGNTCQLKYTHSFGVMYCSIYRKVLVSTDELLRSIGEVNCTLPLWRVEDPILSYIARKGEIFVLLDDINNILCISSSILDQHDSPIIIYQLPATEEIIKLPYFISILIIIFEDVDEVSVIYHLLTSIYVLHY